MQIPSSNKTIDAKMLLQQRQLPTRVAVAFSQVVTFVVLGGGTNFMSILLWLCQSFNLNLKCYPAKCNRPASFVLPLPAPALIFHLFTITTFYYAPARPPCSSPMPSTFYHFIYTPVYICHTSVFVFGALPPPCRTFLTAFLCVCQIPHNGPTPHSPLSSASQPPSTPIGPDLADFDCIFVYFVAILITLMKVLIAK